VEVNRRIQFMKMNIHTALKRTLSVVALMAMTLGAWAEGEEQQPAATNVAKIGDTEYATLKAAVEAATGESSSGTEITLLKSVEEAVTVPSGKTISIDLAGFSVTSPSTPENSIAITNVGTLTLKDTGTNSSATVSTLTNKGTLTMNGGTVTTLTAENGCTIIGTSGTITSITTASGYTVNIQGTGFKDLAGGGIYQLSGDVTSAITIPNGANITLAVGEHTVSGDITCSGTLKITDGTFTGTITNNSGTVAISGGTFDKLPAANCCAAGYIPLTNLDGKYYMHNALTIYDNGSTVTLPAHLNTGAYSVGTATYNRQTGMAAVGSDAGTKYGTICLPFEIKALPTGMTLYKATNIVGSTLKITEVTDIDNNAVPAGTPLIFELTSAATTLTITSSDATINTADPTAPTDGNILVGTYAAKNITDNLTNIYYLNGDKFHQAKVSLTVPAFRAYLVDSTPNEVKGEWLTISNGDDETAISGMDIDENTVVAVYDLNGRKQSALQRGLNIVRRADGSTMKVIVK